MTEYYKKWYELNRESRKQKCKEYYKANQGKIREQNKIYREKHRDYLLSVSKLWRKNNKERKQIIDKNWRENNKEYLINYGKTEKRKKTNAITTRNYYLKNRSKVNKRRNQYYKTERGKSLIKASLSKRRASKKGTGDNSITGLAIVDMLVKQNYCCNNCRIYIKEDYHLDHIIPLSKGGKHIIENVQLLCPSCNLRKASKILPEQLKRVI